MTPSPEGVLLAALSNNDGCVLAADKADKLAKSRGIELGRPWFQLHLVAQKSGLAAVSSNYEFMAAQAPG